MSDHLSGVAVFVEVAHAGSFTLAAERLGSTKSAVSKAVARLEARLGVKLFHRTTRRLALTTNGEAYLASCTAALDVLRNAEAILGGYEASPVGRIRIDMPAAFGRSVVLPLLAELCRENPGLQLSLSFTDRIIDPIEEGVDLALRFGRTTQGAGLMTRTLALQPQHICAAPAYLQRRGVPESIDDLARHDAIVGLRHGAPLRWSVTRDGVEQRIGPPPTHQVGDGDAIVAMAVAGLGLCQMPALLVRPHLDAGTLVTVLDAFRGPDVPVQAVWPGTRDASPRLRFVIDRLAEGGRAGRLG